MHDIINNLFLCTLCTNCNLTKLVKLYGFMSNFLLIICFTLSGELKLYEATASDDKTRLNSVAAAKRLALKKRCPVILIVNLSQFRMNL